MYNSSFLKRYEIISIPFQFSNEWWFRAAVWFKAFPCRRLQAARGSHQGWGQQSKGDDDDDDTNDDDGDDDDADDDDDNADGRGLQAARWCKHRRQEGDADLTKDEEYEKEE